MALRAVAFALGGVCATAMPGCADEREPTEPSEPSELEAYGPPAPRFEPYDYFACRSGAVVPTCSGPQCAENDTDDLLMMFEDAIEAYDVQRHVDVSRSSFHLGQRQLRIEYQVHVGWARSGHVLNLSEDATDEEIERAIEAVFEDLDLPTFLAAPDVVIDGLAECLPNADFDPCTSLESPGVARAFGETGAWVARVDTETGTVLTCGPVED